MLGLVFLRLRAARLAPGGVCGSRPHPGHSAGYEAQLDGALQTDRERKVSSLRRRLTQLQEEEAQVVRLLVTKKISEDTYDQIRVEWLEKVRHAELSLAEIERNAAAYLDNLAVALCSSPA